MRKLLTLAAASVASIGILASPAAADTTCGAIVVDIAGTAYIAEGVHDDGTWVYLESNGVGGLQRGGVALYGADLGGQDPCSHANPDTIVF